MEFNNDPRRQELFNEFLQLRSDDATFAELYSDSLEDFEAWVMDFELDSDWEDK